MRRLLDLARSSHPGPTVAVTAISVVLGIGVGASGIAIALIGAAVLANQLSIGLSNDAIDAERDRAAGRRDKPVAGGAVSSRAVMTIALALAAVSLAMALALGPGVLGADAVLLAAGWTYNLGLKRIAVSLLPYLIGFAALPGVATLALQPPRLPVWWVMGAAGLLGGAAHFANVLPDLADDAAAGVRGTPQLLGRRGSVIACFTLLTAAAVLLVIGQAGVAGTGGVAGVALGLTVVLGAVGVILGLRPTGGRAVFRLVIAAAVVDVVLLGFAGPAIAAATS